MPLSADTLHAAASLKPSMRLCLLGLVALIPAELATFVGIDIGNLYPFLAYNVALVTSFTLACTVVAVVVLGGAKQTRSATLEAMYQIQIAALCSLAAGALLVCLTTYSDSERLQRRVFGSTNSFQIQCVVGACFGVLVLIIMSATAAFFSVQDDVDSLSQTLSYGDVAAVVFMYPVIPILVMFRETFSCTSFLVHFAVTFIAALLVAVSLPYPSVLLTAVAPSAMRAHLENTGPLFVKIILRLLVAVATLALIWFGQVADVVTLTACLVLIIVPLVEVVFVVVQFIQRRRRPAKALTSSMGIEIRHPYVVAHKNF